MKLIEQIEIKNFRSFGNRKGETTKVIKLNELNILSGANDSGKSNILRGLNLFFNGKTNLEDFFNFSTDFFKKEHEDNQDVKEELVTIKIWFRNIKNHKKNIKNPSNAYLPERFWVSRKWKKTSIYEHYDQPSSIETDFKREKGEYFSSFLEEGTDKLRSNIRASLTKQLTEFLGSIQYHYVPAIKDKTYFSHLYGELQQTLWKAKSSQVENKKVDFQLEIQKETAILMQEFKETLNHPTLNFEPIFELPQNLIDLFKTLLVQTGAVDLKYRGDGVQAKLIPEILNYIAIKEKALTSKTVKSGEQSKKYFIWGFEEPENSYEYKNAQLLADRFKDKFIDNAQIFISTHSFNFLSIDSDRVSKYRTWKDAIIGASRVALISKDKNGTFKFDGAPLDDEDSLMEELGFFHLNEEITKAYKKVEILQKEYSERLQTINKPVIYTEGKNTEYLQISKALFDDENEYDIESLGGKTDIKKFFQRFVEANFNRYKILFVFDCDAKADFNACKMIETEYLKPFIFKENEINNLEEVQSGIENLFDSGAFEPENELFDITEVVRNGNITSRNRTLRKNKFLEHIKNNHNNLESFVNFTSLHGEIDIFFSA
ncbi:MAG: AAA family ATPase [Aureibaculum sp.]|nr:AAA family ATPase [Aureibaculum sp.]